MSGLFSSYHASGNWLRRLNVRSPVNRRFRPRTTFCRYSWLSSAVYSMVSSTSAIVLKSNGLAAFGSSSCQTVSTPMPSNGSSIPFSGSSSNSPVASIGEVNAIDSGLAAQRDRVERAAGDDRARYAGRRQRGPDPSHRAAGAR